MRRPRKGLFAGCQEEGSPSWRRRVVSQGGREGPGRAGSVTPCSACRGSPGRSGDAMGRASSRGRGDPPSGGAHACFGLGRLPPLMNLDGIQLPLLLNSLGGLGVASWQARSRGSPSRAGDSVFPPDSRRAGPAPRPPAPGTRDPCGRAADECNRGGRCSACPALGGLGTRRLPSSFACRRPHLVSANNYPVGATQSCHSLRLD